MSVEIREESWTGAAAVELRAQMDAELRPRYADLFDPDAPRTEVDPAQILVTLVAFDGETPVGTTSLKLTDGYAEVKRVFVAESHRRFGLAARLLAAIERAGAERGHPELVLQTELRQPEAMALYVREGWQPIAPFGPYAGDTAISRCYAKAVVPLVVGVELPAAGPAATLLGDALSALRVFEGAGVDLAVVSDRLVPGAAGAAPEARLDAPTLAAYLGSRTETIGLAPVVGSNHSEPFHVAKVVQTLDHTTRGRGAWQLATSASAAEAALIGRRAPLTESEAWAEVDEAVEVAERLWDSWEDDAEIRDAATGRFIDRDRVHHIDFEGRFFSVRGPSIVPRSPQGRPLVLAALDSVDAEEPAVAVAVRRADVIRLGGATASAEGVAAVRALLAAAGRGPEVSVLLDLAAAVDASPLVEESRDEGADVSKPDADGDGFETRPRLAPRSLLNQRVGGDGFETGARFARVFLNQRVAELRARLATLRHDTGADGVVLVFAALPDTDTLEEAAVALATVTRDEADRTRTLRERLGLERPASRYAAGGGASVSAAQQNTATVTPAEGLVTA